MNATEPAKNTTQITSNLYVVNKTKLTNNNGLDLTPIKSNLDTIESDTTITSNGGSYADALIALLRDGVITKEDIELLKTMSADQIKRFIKALYVLRALGRDIRTKEIKNIALYVAKGSYELSNIKKVCIATILKDYDKEPRQYDPQIVAAFQKLAALDIKDQISANLAYKTFVLSSSDLSKLTAENQKIITDAKEKLNRIEAEEKRAKAVVQENNAVKETIESVSQGTQDKKRVMKDKDAIAKMIGLNKRIISFKENNVEKVVFIEYKGGKWVVVNGAAGKYVIAAEGGKLLVDGEQAQLLVDGTWQWFKEMGVSYQLYQQIFADGIVTREEFKKISGATDAAYNFFSLGGVGRAEGDSEITAGDLQAVFQKHIDKVSKGLSGALSVRIIRSYVTADYFIIVDASGAAKKLLSGQESVKAGDLLKNSVAEGSRPTAAKVIRNILGKKDNDPIDNVDLNQAQLEYFIAAMAFLAQVEKGVILGYEVKTDNLADKNALKDPAKVVAWLKGETVEAEERGRESGGGSEAEKAQDARTDIELLQSKKNANEALAFLNKKNRTIGSDPRALSYVAQKLLQEHSYEKAKQVWQKLSPNDQGELFKNYAEQEARDISNIITANDLEGAKNELRKYDEFIASMPAADAASIKNKTNTLKYQLANKYAQKRDGQKTYSLIDSIPDGEEISWQESANSPIKSLSKIEARFMIAVELVDPSPMQAVINDAQATPQDKALAYKYYADLKCKPATGMTDYQQAYDNYSKAFDEAKKAGVAVEVRAGIIEGIEKMIQIMGGNVNYPTQPTNPNKAIINKAIKMYREMMAFNASDKSSKTAVKGKKSNKCLDVDKSPDGICVKKGNK